MGTKGMPECVGLEDIRGQALIVVPEDDPLSWQVNPSSQGGGGCQH